MKDLSLTDYFRVIKKRIWWLFIFMISVPLFLKFTQKKHIPLYRAVARVKIFPRRPVVTVSQGGITWWEQRQGLETEIQTVKSYRVLKHAANLLNLFENAHSKYDSLGIIENIRRKIRASQVKNTDFIEIQVTDVNPEFAASLANAVAQAYIKEYVAERISSEQKQLSFIEEYLKDVEKMLEEYSKRLSDFYASPEYAKLMTAQEMRKKLGALYLKLASLMQTYKEGYPEIQKIKEEIAKITEILKNFPGSNIEYERLTRDLEINKKVYSMLRTKLMEIKLQQLEKIKEPVLASPAVPPRTPINPHTKINLAIGLMAGIILGILACFIAEALDPTFSSVEDIEAKTKLPIVGVIPEMVRSKEKTLIPKDTPELIKESYLLLTVNLMPKIENTKHLVITSSLPGEGKTTTALNLALSIAMYGKKVRLIDFDFKKPSIYSIFNIRANGAEKGCNIVDVLIANPSLRKDILSQPALSNFFFYEAGRYIKDYRRFIESKEFEHLLMLLSQDVDIAIIDTSPILTTSESLLIATKLRKALLVHRLKHTPKTALERAISLLKRNGVELVGITLNMIKPDDIPSSYGYYYKKYYKKYYKYGYAKKMKCS